MALDTTIIEELRKQLLMEKERIEGELGKFATQDEKGEFSTNFPEDLGNERSENATEVEEYTDRLGIEKSLETQRIDITDALERMDNGTYGTDEETGEDIAVERLRAYPAARTNVR